MAGSIHIIKPRKRKAQPQIVPPPHSVKGGQSFWTAHAIGFFTSIRPRVYGKQGPKSSIKLPPRQSCLSPFQSDLCCDVPATRETNEWQGQSDHQQQPLIWVLRDQSFVPSVLGKQEASQRCRLLHGTSTKA